MEQNSVQMITGADIDRIAHHFKKMNEQYEALKDKCHRYEAALREAKETINWMWQHMKEPDGQTLLRVDEFNRPANALRVIDEAISGEGEKEVEEVEYMPIHTAVLRDKEYKGMTDVPLRVPMYLLNEQQAGSNHGQTLARLKERGGISIREALCLINRYPWGYYKGMEARKSVVMLNELINQKEDQQ